MPNSRRRRFSVHNGLGCKETCKIQNGLHSSSEDPTKPNVRNAKTSMKIKEPPSTNKKSSSNKISCPSNVSFNIPSTTTMETTTADKDVTASSSNIDWYNMVNASIDVFEITDSDKCEIPKRSRQPNQENPVLRREKHRQHRIKVRSPKRRPPIQEVQTWNNEVYKRNIGTLPVDWGQDEDVSLESVTNIETIREDERQSDHSYEDMCRICHGGDTLSQELGLLISACSCRGTVGRVHVKCLERWLTESGKSRCELCGTRYATRRVHRYGVPKALVMWILSQNAKQLMVDSLGIMLMSPLAVLAAWLSGKTLAGLMMQDNHATPWPLASTFVLACMTLVCYYCWIVSAATRHALGWWIWYRSQYEVRLTLQDSED